MASDWKVDDSTVRTVDNIVDDSTVHETIADLTKIVEILRIIDEEMRSIYLVRPHTINKNKE